MIFIFFYYFYSFPKWKGYRFTFCYFLSFIKIFEFFFTVLVVFFTLNTQSSLFNVLYFKMKRIPYIFMILSLLIILNEFHQVLYLLVFISLVLQFFLLTLCIYNFLVLNTKNVILYCENGWKNWYFDLEK